MSGLPPLPAEEFEKKTGAGDEVIVLHVFTGKEKCKHFCCHFTGDLSSISGSESDSEQEDLDSDSGAMRSNLTSTDNETSSESRLISGRLSSKVFFQNSAGEYLTVYRCILLRKVNNTPQVIFCIFESNNSFYLHFLFQSEEESDPVSSLKSINQKTMWVILMTGGGHFAGAVFEG